MSVELVHWLVCDMGGKDSKTLTLVFDLHSCEPCAVDRCHAKVAEMSRRALQRAKTSGYLTWRPLTPVGPLQAGKGDTHAGKGMELVADSACRITEASDIPDIEKGIADESSQH